MADAFARQAAVYAQVAASDRAEAAALSTAIATEQQLSAAKAAAAPNAASATVFATSATSVGSTPATIAGVPAAAAKLDDHYQKAAALADRLGANAQALASFHLAQINQLTGAPAEGGAQ